MKLMEQCTESNATCYGHWRRGDTLVCDMCGRTLRVQILRNGRVRIPPHSTRENRTKE